MKGLNLIILFSASLLLSLVLTRLLLWLLPKWGMLDRPDFKRHIHTRVVPRGGGLGMLLAFALVTPAATAWLLPDALPEVLKFLAPLLVLCPLGVADDRLTLRPGIKFLLQTASALLAWLLGLRMVGLFGWHFPLWLDCLCTLFWIVALINAFNMIDGVDGLASGVGLISAVSMVIVAIARGQYELTLILLVLSGSLLGFLRYNWHPARLFMGDTGSMFIGYVLAAAGLALNARLATAASIAIPVLACGIPVLDIFLAVWRRLVGAPIKSESSDEPPPPPDVTHRLLRLLGRLGKADQSHLHHRLLRYFHNNQRKTVLSIYALATLMGIIGIICFILPDNDLSFTLFLVIGTFSLAINRLAVIELWNSAEAIYQNFQTARAGLLLSHAINPVYDLVAVTVSYLLAAGGHPEPGQLIRCTTMVMAVLMLTRNYRVLWNFAVSDDHCRLIGSILLAFALSWLCGLLVVERRLPGVSHIYAAAIAVTLIALERHLVHYLRGAAVRRHLRSALSSDTSCSRTLLFGITPMTRLYRNNVISDIDRAGREQLIGIVARDRLFRHTNCFGLPVIGSLDDLEIIYAHTPFDKLVLTLSPTPTERSRLADFASSRCIRLFLYIEQLESFND